MSNKDLKILCVDDEPHILELYETAVRAAGFTPLTFLNPMEAATEFRKEMQNIALILSDIKMPEMDGFAFRKALLPEGQNVPFVVVSSFITKDMALAALDNKIANFFSKPINQENIKNIVEKEAKDRIDQIRENHALANVFLEEAQTIIEDMEPTLLSLDQDRTNQDTLNLIYRGAHTLKGSSGVLDAPVITRYIHKYEDVISALRKGEITLDDSVYQILLSGYDRIKELIGSVHTKTTYQYRLNDLLPELEVTKSTPSAGVAKGDAQPQQAKADTQKQKPKDTVPVPITMLDEISSFSGEITVIRNMVNKIVRFLERKYVGDRDVQSLGELLDEMHKINSVIQMRITDLRKVPLSNVLRPIPRIIRDLSRDLKKEIRLHLEGETLRIDNSLAQVCSNSLVHLIRNSADHGLETPEERRNKGKSEQGNVTVSAVEDREEVIVVVKDDGRGIDPSRVKAKAIEKNIHTREELDLMNEKQILSLIFASGFSTAAQVTDVSGRGVGMDMVRSSAEAVGGHVEVDSTVGEGSKFTLRLPLPKSVQIISALVVGSSQRTFAIPQDTIVRVLRLEPSQYASTIQHAASGEVLRNHEKLYPLLKLDQVLSLKELTIDDATRSNFKSDTIDILILQVDGIQFALRVDSIFDTEEIVVKKMLKCFNPNELFAGATFMGDGSVGLILDIKSVASHGKILQFNANLSAVASAGREVRAGQSVKDQRNYLLFKIAGNAIYGAPLNQVYRLEELDRSQFQVCGSSRVLIYRDQVMPILSLAKALKLKEASTNLAAPKSERVPTIVIRDRESFLGLEVDAVVDIAEGSTEISSEIRDRIGVSGNLFIRDNSVTMLDLPTIIAKTPNRGGSI